MISMSGAVGIITLDACERCGLEIAKLSPETERNITEILPPWMAVSNPVDFWPVIASGRHPVDESVRTVLYALLSDQNVDALLLFTPTYFERFSPPISQLVIEAANTFRDKPIAWLPFEGWLYQVHTSELEEKVANAGVAIFPSPERAIRALAGLADYSEFRPERSDFDFG